MIKISCPRNYARKWMTDFHNYLQFLLASPYRLEHFKGNRHSVLSERFCAPRPHKRWTFVDCILCNYAYWENVQVVLQSTSIRNT